MENPIPAEPVYNRNVLEMLAVTNECCLFVENAENYTKDDLYGFFQKICPLLYLKGALLPFVDPSNPEANERFVLEEKWEIIFNILREKFQPYDEFCYADDALDKNAELIKGSLAEHFADIYQDLKDFVILYQRNSLTAKENAVAECRRLFMNHWGIRITITQNAMHLLNYPESKDPDIVF
jgi:hypothetical protein